MDSALLIFESDWRATSPPPWSTIPSNISSQNFESSILFNVVEKSGSFVFEDDPPPIFFKWSNSLQAFIQILKRFRGVGVWKFIYNIFIRSKWLGDSLLLIAGNCCLLQHQRFRPSAYRHKIWKTEEEDKIVIRFTSRGREMTAEIFFTDV